MANEEMKEIIDQLGDEQDRKKSRTLLTRLIGLFASDMGINSDPKSISIMIVNCISYFLIIILSLNEVGKKINSNLSYKHWLKLISKFIL